MFDLPFGVSLGGWTEYVGSVKTLTLQLVPHGGRIECQPPTGCPQVMRFGWRLGYVFGMVIGLAGVWLRRGLEESPEFLDAKAEMVGDNVAPANPLKDAFTKYYKEVLIVMCTVSIWCASSDAPHETLPFLAFPLPFPECPLPFVVLRCVKCRRSVLQVRRLLHGDDLDRNVLRHDERSGPCGLETASLCSCSSLPLLLVSPAPCPCSLFLLLLLGGARMMGVHRAKPTQPFVCTGVCDDGAARGRAHLAPLLRHLLRADAAHHHGQTPALSRAIHVGTPDGVGSEVQQKGSTSIEH